MTAGAEIVARGATGRSGRLRRVVAAGLAALVLVGVATVGGAWMWVQRSADGRVHTAAGADRAPVGLVLGAGLTEANRPGPFLAARLDVAAELYRAGKVEVLLVSGDNRTAEHNEPDAMRRYLIERQAIPAESVVADYAGRNTYDSCVRAKQVFGVEQALVISQGYHVPRAVAICRAVGLRAEGVGDWTAERFADAWRAGARRELMANVKALGDVLASREPVLGTVERAVTDALRRAGSGTPAPADLQPPPG